MPICPDCLSRHLVKFGKYKEWQKYHCLDCNLTTIHPRTRMPKGNREFRPYDTAQIKSEENTHDKK